MQCRNCSSFALRDRDTAACNAETLTLEGITRVALKDCSLGDTVEYPDGLTPEEKDSGYIFNLLMTSKLSFKCAFGFKNIGPTLA
jgi:hypothetical protein